MIYATGHLAPRRDQLIEGRAQADDSFCTLCSASFLTNFPSFEGFSLSSGTVLLKLKNVEPHDDPWVGNGREPRARRAIFWLLEGGGQSAFNGRLFFGCGRHHVKMVPGDFVVFNDRLTHWVMSERLWRGAAIQLVTV